MNAFLLAAGIVAGVALVAALSLVVAWRLLRPDQRSLARRVGRLAFRDKLALGRAIFRDARVPRWARFVAVALALYLASPIDLVPDFIPLLGQLDDVLIVLVGGALLVRAVPAAIIEEHLTRLEARRAAVA